MLLLLTLLKQEISVDIFVGLMQVLALETRYLDCLTRTFPLILPNSEGNMPQAGLKSSSASKSPAPAKIPTLRPRITPHPKNYLDNYA